MEILLVPQKLLGISRQLNTYREALVSLNTGLLKLNCFRYKYFVDAGPQGINCTYAKLTYKAFMEANELGLLRKQLIDMRAAIDHMLECIDGIS